MSVVTVYIPTMQLLKEPTVAVVSLARKVFTLRERYMLRRDQPVVDVKSNQHHVVLDIPLRMFEHKEEEEDVTRMLFWLTCQAHYLRAQFTSSLVDKPLVVDGTQATIVQVEDNGTILVKDSTSNRTKHVPLTQRTFAACCKLLD